MKKLIRILFYISFVVYVCALFYILILSRRQGNIEPFSFLEYVLMSSNFIPFKGIFEYVQDYITNNTGTGPLYNIFGNLIMCFPLGIYLTLFLKRKANSKRIILTTALIIFILEMIQLIQIKGHFDIDDLILNTLGAWIGYLILQNKYIIKIIQVVFGKDFYESY